MGWISNRHMRQGGSIGGKRRGRAYPKEGAPLRRVVGTVVTYHNIFRPDRVLLECGHEADSWGGVRARCPACKQPR